MILGKNFEDIDSTTIQSLIDSGASETAHLEFKRESYGNADADKKEFLKDICSFSNCLGGHLIIGIEEAGGVASSVTPLSGVDVDKELLRLESIVRTGIEPSIIGLRMKRVDIGGGSIIVIHIPKSFNPPHRVIFKNNNRYLSRNAAGTYELSLEELRMLFGEQRTIEERASAFVSERFLKIQADDGAMSMPLDGGTLVMHLISLPDFGANRRIDISRLSENQVNFLPVGGAGYSWRINLEGFVVYRGGDKCHGYTQLFRNGALEATKANVFSPQNGRRFLASLKYPAALIRSLNQYMKGLKELEATPPLLLQISFMGMQGVNLAVDMNRVFDPPPTYERELLHLPASLITEYRDDGNYEAIIAEQMHFLWNVFGFQRCFYFSDNDRWVG
ncbi:AlbA family DNA-binding domain-containing protein [Pseudovibrio ascidiaceicola]|uniref:AlbA family DNA-binding domain-containing protein n=1 Tax=Pseudovibrio ascidiaceicola TaxID=285279 RepID=UPI000D694A11|nr:ATP-binding protein [Pseudovibrio ascidiaceicola]